MLHNVCVYGHTQALEMYNVIHVIPRVRFIKIVRDERVKYEFRSSNLL